MSKHRELKQTREGRKRFERRQQVTGKRKHPPGQKSTPAAKPISKTQSGPAVSASSAGTALTSLPSAAKPVDESIVQVGVAVLPKAGRGRDGKTQDDVNRERLTRRLAESKRRQGLSAAPASQAAPKVTAAVLPEPAEVPVATLVEMPPEVLVEEPVAAVQQAPEPVFSDESSPETPSEAVTAIPKEIELDMSLMQEAEGFVFDKERQQYLLASIPIARTPEDLKVGQLFYVDPEFGEPDPTQPRKDVDLNAEDIVGLQASIRSSGQEEIGHICLGGVQRTEKWFWVLNGGRRFAACLGGQMYFLALVKPTPSSKFQKLAAQGASNVHRKDLLPIEEAWLIAELEAERPGITHKQLELITGLKPATIIQQRYPLLKLIPQVQRMMSSAVPEEERLGPGVAVEIAKVTPLKQLSFAEEAVKGKMTIQKVRFRVRDFLGKDTQYADEKNPRKPSDDFRVLKPFIDRIANMAADFVALGQQAYTRMFANRQPVDQKLALAALTRAINNLLALMDLVRGARPLEGGEPLVHLNQAASALSAVDPVQVAASAQVADTSHPKRLSEALAEFAGFLTQVLAKFEEKFADKSPKYCRTIYGQASDIVHSLGVLQRGLESRFSKSEFDGEEKPANGPDASIRRALAAFKRICDQDDKTLAEALGGQSSRFYDPLMFELNATEAEVRKFRARIARLKAPF